MSATLPSPNDSRLGRIGCVLAPLLAIIAYVALGAVDAPLAEPARRVAAVVILMATWWLTEAIPLAATALVPLFLFPLLGVSGIQQTAAPYADPLIFLFLGGFLLGIAFESSGLHRRIALLTLRLVGSRPASLVAGVMVATAIMSMWVSNTASTIMMVPIAASLAAISTSRSTELPDPPARRAFAVCLYLGIAYAASLGGMGTPIGTPPNAIAFARLSEHSDHPINFRAWMIAAVPLILILLPLIWLLLTRLLFPIHTLPPLADRSFVRARLRELGRPSNHEWTTLAVFLLAVLFWIAREPLCRILGLVDLTAGAAPKPRLSDAGIAIGAALLLFLLPTGPRSSPFVLSLPHFARVPWSILVLFGGGLSLAQAMDASGLTDAAGTLFRSLSGLPLIVILLLTALLVTFLSELASNTAVAATLVPILDAAARTLDMPAELLIIPATLACSFGFALPVATPPNAIVYATGQIGLRDLMRAGIVVDLVCVVVLAVLYSLFGRYLLG
ncbi:MAG: SLC13 family permease [Phycisphaerales bacterium]